MDDLVPQIYDQLRALAARYSREDPHATLQPTVLVHEAWMRLAKWQGEWESEGHFRAPSRDR